MRTALTVEARDGRLCLFLPPVTSAEDYVDLVTAIEDTAAELACLFCSKVIRPRSIRACNSSR